jgi:prephenate dehydrogenase
MKIGIIGLGMIGGSLAKALHARTGHEVVGYDLNPATRAEASAAGVIKGVLDLDDLPSCETLILAIPPKGCLAFLREHASRIAPGTLVVDCCGVKRSRMKPSSAAWRSSFCPSGSAGFCRPPWSSTMNASPSPRNWRMWSPMRM